MSVPAFAIDRYKVTNGQYLEFVRGGRISGPQPVDAGGLGLEDRRAISRIPLFGNAVGDELASIERCSTRSRCRLTGRFT